MGVKPVRSSASSRGYDRKWQAFRLAFLANYPLCADCESQGRLTAAAEVHHVQRLRDHPDLRLVESNCLGLCTPCHSARTARETRGLPQVIGCGVDGRPRDSDHPWRRARPA